MDNRAFDDIRVGSVRAGDGDRFAFEIDILVIHPGTYEDDIAVRAGINGILDMDIIPGHMPDSRVADGRQKGHAQSNNDFSTRCV